MAFDMLIGNEALRARLERDIRAHALSHAYLIEGAVGSGRRTLATAICAALACHRADGGTLPCGECLACRKVNEGKAVDVIRVTKQSDKASIGVDEIRFIRTDVLLPPNEMENKVYIIEDADLMTVQAQNALLLTLEEPPPYVLFLLLCTSATGLLETIRSRAPLLRLEPICPEAMADYLMTHDRTFGSLSPAERQEILLLSDGSMGRALVLTDARERGPLTDRRELAARYVAAAIGRGEGVDMLALLAAFGNKRDEISALLCEVQVALRDLILLKRSETVSLRFYTDREQAEELCGRVSVKALLSLFDRVERTRRQLARNANVRLTLTSLFFLS